MQLASCIVVLIPRLACLSCVCLCSIGSSQIAVEQARGHIGQVVKKELFGTDKHEEEESKGEEVMSSVAECDDVDMVK